MVSLLLHAQLRSAGASLPLDMKFTLFTGALCALLAFAGPVTADKRDNQLPARVPYIFPPPGTNAVRVLSVVAGLLRLTIASQIADKMRSFRAGGVLLDLDGALLNNPLVANTWTDFFQVVRRNLTIPGNIRELLILRTAVANTATYQWLQHEPVARSENMTTDQLLFVRFAPQKTFSWNDGRRTGLSDAQLASMAFSDWMADNVRIPDKVYNAVKSHFNTSQIMEITITAGSYALVSRLTVGLELDSDEDVELPVPQ
ncbi:unnamed protein product [Mycena citricolor]|uniref:4-carboxymuconolactone decarboxylase n=1 Tax=Mycena citricolor TaxID=2018698 RepID=A0AAD2HEI5_9AGAR|nr:unnamed protein product [Mycena citricolor]